MVMRSIGIGMAVLLVAACGTKGPSTTPDTQTFTRNVDATPSRVVEAATSVFADRRIPVAKTDQTNGTVVSVPLDPRAEWGDVPTDQRVDCRAVALPDADSRLVLTVRVKRDNERSVLALDAKRDGGESCVLRGPFMTGLMDDIIARASS